MMLNMHRPRGRPHRADTAPAPEAWPETWSPAAPATAVSSARARTSPGWAAGLDPGAAPGRTGSSATDDASTRRSRLAASAIRTTGRPVGLARVARPARLGHERVPGHRGPAPDEQLQGDRGDRRGPALPARLEASGDPVRRPVRPSRSSRSGGNSCDAATARGAAAPWPACTSSCSRTSSTRGRFDSRGRSAGSRPGEVTTDRAASIGSSTKTGIWRVVFAW